MEKKYLIFLFIIVTTFIFANDENLKRQVIINYNLYHIPKIASNQLAIWIEDDSGNIVRTLFVTKFTANGGYKKRAQSLKLWVKKSDLKNKQKNDIDAFSSATQRSGKKNIIWDCRNEKGDLVKNGKYYYCIEGNISWDNEVYVRGEIIVGEMKNESVAIITYLPENNKPKDLLIDDVKAYFE